MTEGDTNCNNSLLSTGCINARSLCNKICKVLELLMEFKIDICCVTETWLNQNDSAIFAEIHDFGFDIRSVPRRGKGWV